MFIDVPAKPIVKHGEFPFELVFINDESDGTFPNHHPYLSIEENLSQLKAKVLDT